MRPLPILFSLLLSISLIGALRAQQDEPAQPAPPSDEPAPERDTPPADDPLGDLDDLLDIPEEDRDTPRGESDPGEIDELDTNRRELDDRLSAREVSDQFKQAILQMGEAADRMARAGDTGIETQRIQQEVITKLDILIKSQQQQGSSNQQQQPQQNQDPQQSPSQPQQASQQQQTAQQGENTSEIDPPAFEAAELQRRLDLSTAEWGELPQRLRDLIMQGMSGKHSALYEELTRAFYRRLAESEDR